MILNRFGVRGRLNLLLVPPLIAVLLVATPLVLGQVENARSAGRTADAASQARQLGALVWELQRELLVTSAYVASPTADSSTVLEQQRTVADSIERVRASLGPNASDELAAALTRLGSLDELRRNALVRGVSVDSLARTYHAVTEAVINALRLIPRNPTGTAGADAESTRALVAMDALLRANEFGALRSTALITAAVSPAAGRNLLNNATSRTQILTERFVEQADIGHAALVVTVDQGEAGRSIDALARQVPAVGDQAVTDAFITDALASGEAQANLRRVVQDRVTTEIADAAAGRRDAATSLATGVGIGAAALLALVMLLSVIVSRSIARPLRTLTSSATTVADLASTELTKVADSEDAEEKMPQLARVDVASGGEVGALGAAFNRVQSTAAELLDRQVSNRRNVSLMFANVARRTQNLVHRQLAVVDELERNEQDPKLLDGLYRLDHLSTRLRRSADKLLVVAGSREQAMITEPIDLGTALRSAMAEIEDYKRVRLGALCKITLTADVASDLVLIFAELLENATAFSPPDTQVELSARIQEDGACLVLIVDRGMGMSDEQLSEENRRLVERERLDIAPTGMLGLFVVGRLARRHSLTVGLVNTPGGGVSALLTIPPGQFSPATPHPAPVPPKQVAPPRTPAKPIVPMMTIPQPQSPDDGFVWFEPNIPGEVPALALASVSEPTELPPLAAPAMAPPDPQQQLVTGSALEEPADSASADPPATSADPSHEGLRRRVPGAQLPSAVAGASAPDAQTARSGQDLLAVRAALDDYQEAIAEAARQRDDRPIGNPPIGDQLAEHRRPPQGHPPPVQLSVATSAADQGSMEWPPRPTPRPTSGRMAPGPGSVAVERRAGLTRRVPGANLAPGLRRQGDAELADVAGAAWEERNPNAERHAFDGLAAGLARANASVNTPAAATDGDGHQPEPIKESPR